MRKQAPAPVGYCRYCNRRFYVPHHMHYERCEAWAEWVRVNVRIVEKPIIPRQPCHPSELWKRAITGKTTKTRKRARISKTTTRGKRANLEETTIQGKRAILGINHNNETKGAGMKTIKIALRKLKKDKSILRLRPTNLFFVSRYRAKYRMGVAMPLIIVHEDKRGSYTIISGYHRYEAMLAEFGPDYQVEVVVNKYANRKEILEEVVRENEQHGNPLTGISRRMLRDELLRHGATPEELSQLFGVPVRAVEKWGEKTILVVNAKGTTANPKPKKRGLDTPDGTIPYKLYEQEQKASLGVDVVVMTGQLIRWLDNNLINPNEENTVALQNLQASLEGYFERLQKRMSA